MTLTAADVVNAHPAFYGNPHVRALATEPRWTVSDSEKVPINVRAMAETGVIWGAHEISESCLMRLDELVSFLPSAANNAYYLRSVVDGYMVLDIEKTCPPEIAAPMVAMASPYSEVSMSGRGYHLLLPLPKNFWDYPIATTKRVLKGPEGQWEILLDHWVTFTRRPATAEQLAALEGVRTARGDDVAVWEDVYASLAKEAVETPTVEFGVDVEPPDVPLRDLVIEHISKLPLEKGLEDFGGDWSAFEFSALGTVYNRMRVMLTAVRESHPEAVYDEPVQAWFIYEAARKLIPPRDKHEETRNGLPLLLSSAVSLVGMRSAAEEGDRQARKGGRQ